MQKALVASAILTAVLILPKLSFAATSSVSVNNVINSSSSNTFTSTSSNQTDIVVESNGVRKEYHGPSNGNIKVEANDGNVSITNDSKPVDANAQSSSHSTSSSATIINNVSAAAVSGTDATVSASPMNWDFSSTDAAELEKEVEEHRKTLLEKIDELIEEFWKIFK